jgi:hypothetical protein
MVCTKTGLVENSLQVLGYKSLRLLVKLSLRVSRDVVGITNEDAVKSIRVNAELIKATVSMKALLAASISFTAKQKTTSSRASLLREMFLFLLQNQNTCFYLIQ